jgi:hypothetical protein
MVWVYREVERVMLSLIRAREFKREVQSLGKIAFERDRSVETSGPFLAPEAGQ